VLDTLRCTRGCVDDLSYHGPPLAAREGGRLARLANPVQAPFTDHGPPQAACEAGRLARPATMVQAPLREAAAMPVQGPLPQGGRGRHDQGRAPCGHLRHARHHHACHQPAGCHAVRGPRAPGRRRPLTNAMMPSKRGAPSPACREKRRPCACRGLLRQRGGWVCASPCLLCLVTAALCCWALNNANASRRCVAGSLARAAAGRAANHSRPAPGAPPGSCWRTRRSWAACWTRRWKPSARPAPRKPDVFRVWAGVVQCYRMQRYACMCIRTFAD